MKNINISNRIGLSLNAAMLALLVGSLVLGLNNNNPGRVIHSARKATPANVLGHSGGLRCDNFWWLRRWIPI
jgi:hypothetical protein